MTTPNARFPSNAYIQLATPVRSSREQPEVPDAPVRIDHLTMDELETTLQDMGIPKDVREKIKQDEKERREKRKLG